MSQNIIQCASPNLVLYTDQASTSAVFNTQWTWTNILLRQIIGDDMYEKYDTFNIVLNSAMSTSTSAAFNTAAITAAATDDRSVIFSLTGPAWQNSSYSWKNKTNTSTAPLGNYDIPTGTTIGQPAQLRYSQMNVNTFAKSGNSFDLNISLTRVIKNATTNSYACGGATNGIQQNFPNFAFFFVIIGADLSEKGRRLHPDLIPVVPRGGGTR